VNDAGSIAGRDGYWRNTVTDADKCAGKLKFENKYKKK
jgi:hypothetical protein